MKYSDWVGKENMSLFRQYELHFHRIGSRMNFNRLWDAACSAR